MAPGVGLIFFALGGGHEAAVKHLVETAPPVGIAGIFQYKIVSQ
jgi:hypothetical protein